MLVVLLLMVLTLGSAATVVMVVLPLLSLLLVQLLDGPQLLLQLHPAVLEPDLDLSLSEAERVSDLNAASPGQVVVEVELLLQLQGLESSVSLASASSGTAVRAWKETEVFDT